MAVTSLTTKRLGKALVNATALGSADTIATNATGEDMVITSIMAYNQHGSAVELTVCQVDDNAGAVGTDTANDIFIKESIPSEDVIFLGPEELRMCMNDTNDTIQAYADVADKINLWVFGYVLPDQS